MAFVFWLYLLNTVFMLVIAVREARRPAVALNCLTVGFILPVVGFLFYLITSNPARIRRKRLTCPDSAFNELPDSFSQSTSAIAKGLKQFTVHGLRTCRVQVLTNGIETYANLMESLRKAKKTIDLEYYIFRNDQVGSRIIELLIERAEAGVRIRFIRDGWGGRQIPRSQVTRMMSAGIKVRTMFPLRFPWIFSTLNYRDHCKIVVVDGREAFTGGINVGYEYTGLKPKVGFWRDTHVRLAGDVEADLQAIFDVHWSIASPERRRKTSRGTSTEDTRNPNSDPKLRPRSFPIRERVAFSGMSNEWSTELSSVDVSDTTTDIGARPEVYVQTLEGNPLLPTQIVRTAYFICLTQATQTVDITTPYFIPDADIIMAVKTAAARGVRVRLLVPHHVDQKIVGPASRTFYGELVEAGVQLYLYDKGVLHAKVMVIDGEIAEVGAANYDTRSFRLDYEVCEVIYSADVARELTEQFERDLADSIPLHIEDLRQRSVPVRILEQGARLLSPLL